jgi:signal transduction histidine kinase
MKMTSPATVGAGFLFWSMDFSTVLEFRSSLRRASVSEQNYISTSDPVLQAKLNALAEFAAGAGHEINNPVATIVGRAELLLKNETDPERRHALLTIGAQALRIRDMIGDLMLFARPPKPELQRQSLPEAIADVLQRLEEHFRAKSLQVQREDDEDVPVLADPTQLRVVISNLLLNSVAASNPRGVIVVSAKHGVVGTTACGVLEIQDHGAGFSEIEREHLFDPFFSGRQAGRGLGFGLCKCWRIVEQHGGWIECESSPERGTVFRVFLPTGVYCRSCETFSDERSLTDDPNCVGRHRS